MNGETLTNLDGYKFVLGVNDTDEVTTGLSVWGYSLLQRPRISHKNLAEIVRIEVDSARGGSCVFRSGELVYLGETGGSIASATLSQFLAARENGITVIT